MAEGAAPAGDLSEEVDEVQNCGVRPPGEEEGYDADSESNPGDMAKQEEGRPMQTNISKYYHCHATHSTNCCTITHAVNPVYAFS